MSRRAAPSGPDGLVLVDKPAGWTSHDVVARARRLCATRKVGHAGTLDPMATGVLVLGVGRATRLLTFLVGADKDYTATIRLGQSTLTDDAEGDVTSAPGADGLDREDVVAAALALTGAIDQVPDNRQVKEAVSEEVRDVCQEQLRVNVQREIVHAIREEVKERCSNR